LGRHLNGSLNEPSIHVGLDEPLTESYQRPFTERRLLAVQTIQHQLPASIHHRRLNDFII